MPNGNMLSYVHLFQATKDMAKAAGVMKDSDKLMVARHSQLMEEAREQFENMRGIPRNNQID